MSATAGFKTETAVALSNITIVGGAISNFCFNVGRRHEYFDKPLIDWELILVMEPTTILGALIGGYLNKAGLLNSPDVLGSRQKPSSLSCCAYCVMASGHLHGCCISEQIC